MTTNDLNHLLVYLAGHADAALQRWADQQLLEDDEFELNEDYRPWLTLERNSYDWNWQCGFRVQPDEATEWTIVASGTTPLAAAQALQALLAVQAEERLHD